MKIAIYSGVIPSTTFIERLIVGLSNENNEVLLFGSSNKKMLYSKNVLVYTYSNKFSKLFSLLKYSILLVLFKRKEKKELDRLIGNNLLKKVKFYPILYNKPEVFHLQWAKGVEEWMWVQKFGIKLIISLRGAHINYSPIADVKLKEKYLDNFPKVNGFHAVSKAIALEAEKYGADLNKCKVVYSGFNLTNFEFNIKKENTNSSIEIISIGRSHWKKGYTYALDAFSILKQEGFDFEYSIIGVEDDEELLFQRNQLDLEAEVVFKKGLAFEQIIKEIHKADILLLPSIEEGIANVVLEAMALGTIVISTNCGGMEEVVKDNETGFIVPIREPNKIAEAIVGVSKLSIEEYNSITKKARNIIENQNKEEKMIEDMKSLYNLVLND